MKDSERNPLTTEKDDEIQNDQQQEDKGTEFDGLQVILSLLFHISLKIQSKLKKKRMRMDEEIRIGQKIFRMMTKKMSIQVT